LDGITVFSPATWANRLSGELQQQQIVERQQRPEALGAAAGKAVLDPDRAPQPRDNRRESRSERAVD